MQRIPLLPTDSAPEASKPLLDAIHKQMGKVPHLMSTLAHSPSALGGYLQLAESLSKGSLTPKVRESLAIAIAGKNHCDYCASAHTFIGKNTGLSETELSLNLTGHSEDKDLQTLLQFALNAIDTQGNVTDSTLQQVKDAGFSDSDITEVVAHIGMNTLTNIFNHIAQTKNDFPLVTTN